jgi:prepilin-type N-terminal cleavage/methylation domain-containing protein
MTAASQHPLRLAAFTLVEVLTVLLILGIASAIIIPQLGSRDDLKLRAAARTLVADLMYAQNLSIATQQEHGLSLVFQGSTPIGYAVKLRSSGQIIDHPIDKTPYVRNLGTAAAHQSMRTVTISSTQLGNQLLVFDSLGTPALLDGTTATAISQPLQLRLACGDTPALIVAVEPYTGDVTVSTEN